MIDRIDEFQKAASQRSLVNKREKHEHLINDLKEYEKKIKLDLVDIGIVEPDHYLIDSFEKMNENFEELFSKGKFKQTHLNELKEYLKKFMFNEKITNKISFKLVKKKSSQKH